MGDRLNFQHALTSVAQGFSPVASDTFIVARVERIDGVPKLVAVALADVAGDRLVSRVAVGLGGIRRGGRYVFYRATAPIGLGRPKGRHYEST